MKRVLVSLLLIAALDRAAPPDASPQKTHQKDSAEVAMQHALQHQRESLDKQRQSVHRQMGEQVNRNIGISVADFIAPLPSLLQSACTALDTDSVDSLVAEAAERHTLPPALLRAVIKQESAFRPCAISVRGAQGLMQLMPATAQQFHVSDPFDPVQSVQAGAAFLKQLLNRYKGDLAMALAAYNAGPLRADQKSTRPFPLETQSYLTSIFADLDSHGGETAPLVKPGNPSPEHP